MSVYLPQSIFAGLSLVLYLFYFWSDFKGILHLYSDFESILKEISSNLAQMYTWTQGWTGQILLVTG